jgi:hypothetical protein
MGVLMPDKEETGFLSRWSQRKRQIELEEKQSLLVEEQELELEDKLAEAPISPESQQDEDKEPTPEELEMQANLEAAEAIDLETLEYESDFQVFMKKGVPDVLKNAAMRKLWRSNPMLAVLDGLNDYDEDFGDKKLNFYKSTWEVGRGFLTDEEMNHNPVDKVKAALSELISDEPEKESKTSKETIVADEELSLDEDETLETHLPEEEISEALLAEEMIEEPMLDEQPKRVSLRSRIFDQIEDDV